ncbi:lysine--tRNA ligase [Thermotoga sp. KOL6]|uniref:lysine--tRNA ligase n=1 Tax=Thermotoga sp. KOL6 TaxID=126741 RepID=UPI000C75BBEB|nr:lysine--tRNA ligase [Thermotoga sp. KOL6]PLV60090.1 lysine--tRNA ligase [Thermotoga sp. KOL6]
MLKEFKEQRIKEIQELRSMKINPYPYRFVKEMSASEIKEKYDYLQAGEVLENEKLSFAGRVMSVRHHGKTAFFHLKDDTGRIQSYIRSDTVGKEKMNLFKKHVKIGDFIGVKGFPFKSKTGELTIYVEEYVLLSKALRPLPEKWHGIKDKEIIYRQRYLELIVNDEAIERFRKRFKAIQIIREFLNSRGFVEVETPILHYVTGGAEARPFVTHLNVFDIDMYLRIAPELYLKRLIVGGFEKIYEIGKNFRNEGISYKHSPEFTSVEIYQAYADYNDMMDLTEELIVEVVKKTCGTLKVVYQGKEIDFTPPWKRVRMREFLQEKLGVDILEDRDEVLLKKLEEHGVEVEIKNRAHLIDKLRDIVEEELVNPTFVIDHPVVISPLAKRHREDPRLTERFELIIFGREIANAFSELNDPVDQYQRFLEQARMREEGDEEAHMMDMDFVRALEYGMPPTGGLGIGLDRLFMFITDSPTIRDIIPFPLVKPKKFEEEEAEFEGGIEE